MQGVRRQLGPDYSEKYRICAHRTSEAGQIKGGSLVRFNSTAPDVMAGVSGSAPFKAKDRRHSAERHVAGFQSSQTDGEFALRL